MKKASRVIWVCLLVAMIAVALPAAAQTGGTRHVVQRGETLFRIGLRYGVTVDALAHTNGIANPNRIYAGQVLIIPDSSASVPSAPAAQPSAASSTTTHMVQRGEHLSMIARHYGVSTAAIAQANGLANPSLIFAGQRLIIPAQGAASSAAIQPAPSASSTTHVVQRGETLYRIGLRYGTSAAAIAQANGLANPSLIFAGQRLTIPAPGTAISVASAAGVQPTIWSGKQIVVDISNQMIYAFENGVLVNSSLVSTGVAAAPTVQGDFRVYVKYTSTTMSGPGYYLPGVPYTMYYYRGYGVHGTYWHNNFGRPMSHGCVNLPTSVAKWFFYWAPLGTAVHVQW
jgi:LysM repeat protein